MTEASNQDRLIVAGGAESGLQRPTEELRKVDLVVFIGVDYPEAVLAPCAVVIESIDGVEFRHGN